MDKLKQIPARFLEIWKSWSRNQKIIIVSAVAVFIAAVVVIAVVLSRPTYQELTRCEDYNEMNTVTSLLTDNGYTYQIDNRILLMLRCLLLLMILNLRDIH